jgi:hypothetical protein
MRGFSRYDLCSFGCSNPLKGKDDNMTNPNMANETPKPAETPKHSSANPMEEKKVDQADAKPSSK